MAHKKHEKHADSEIGVIRKDPRGRIRIALVYPNHYHLGMSNLGFQTVYALLNHIEEVVCERAFLPENDKAPLRTIESRSPLSEFDMVAFSVSFEHDFPNILKILAKSHIPLLSAERDESDPLIIAGGVACFLNPEPISPFIDCFLIGEAEEMPLSRFCDLIARYSENRKKCLEILAEIPGVYVPLLAPYPVRRVFSKDFSGIPAHTTVLSRDTAFDNAFLIETGRGCPHGCRFCAAGFVYRPPRFASADRLIETVEIGASLTDRIGLVGAAVSDLPDIGKFCAYLEGKNIRASFGSLRADLLSPALLAVLRQSMVKTATIAPEAGSERMRNVIGKGITEDQILHAAELLVSGGIPNLKLYFMIGLPTETGEDVLAIPELCEKIKARFLSASRAKGRIGEITVSLNCFVPKPFTPFQWAAMDEVVVLKQKINMIRNKLKGIPNLRLRADEPRHAFVRALLSRGDRRVAEILSQAHRNDGNWAKTLKHSAFDPKSLVCRERDFDEILPWDFINHGIDKSFLIREYERAKAGKSSPVCGMKTDSCKLCGVC